MANREITITEVTRMGSGKVCVAGIDLASRQMVRLLQTSGANWEQNKGASADGILRVGNVVGAAPAPVGKSDFPHASEDFRIARIGVLRAMSDAELYGLCEETADQDLTNLFSGHLAEEKYVVAKTPCRSLGCLLVSGHQLRAEVSFDKPKLRYTDNWGQRHYLPVTELTTSAFDTVEAGIVNLQERIDSAAGAIALRLGLARAWSGAKGEYDPARCYLQLNGIILPA